MNLDILAIFVIFTIFIVVVIYLAVTRNSPSQPSDLKSSTCSATCSVNKNIDPVSEPTYNMKEIAKQSILLEEHLAQERKRCKDCIAKHFLHIIGLSEEAVSLAGDSLSKYPLMDEAPILYNKHFNNWLLHHDNPKELLQICTELRNMRKEIVATYVTK